MEAAQDFGMVDAVEMVIGLVMQRSVKKRVLKLKEKRNATCQRLKGHARVIIHAGTTTKKGELVLSSFTAAA